MKPSIFEKGQHVYLVTPVAPIDVGDNEIDELAFAADLRKMAPNDNLMWLRGQYVEADTPNQNGQMWTAGELGIKAVTVNLMPVTVMHDPRTAVGMIADGRLLLPDKDGVPRSRIDTTLGLWRHRFPEVAEEAQHNYEHSTLMQSMECHTTQYTCAECGMTFPKLPDRSERANWCSHMAETDGWGARILGNVIFTGTGLIFGSRGARGANDSAHLEVFQDEVAEFHEKAKRESRSRPRSRRTQRMDPIEISREEYAELQKRPSQDDLAAEKKRADDAEERAEAAEKKVEETEGKLTKAEGERDDLKKQVDDAAEEKAKADLAKERLSKLGKGFMEKLGDFTKGRVEEQAKSLSDEEWDARLKELEETAGVKREEGAGEGGSDGGDEGKGEEFSREETAQAGVGGGSNGNNGNGEEPSAQQRQSVMRGLVTPAKAE